MTDHDGDGRSPRAIAGDTTLGFSRVRPRQERHPRVDDGQRDHRRKTDHQREPAGFEAEHSRERTRERWKAMAFVLCVLVTLTLVAEAVAQVAGGVDVFAVGASDLALFRRIDSALATTAMHARYVAVAAGGFAVVGAGAVGLVTAVRSCV